MASIQHADIDHTGITGVGGAAATGGEVHITAPVTMTNADTYYDGASQSLAAGTYLIWGSITVILASTAGHVAVRLWDGTNVFHEPEEYQSTAGGTHTHSAFAYVVLGSTTTVKISASRNGGNNTSTIRDTNQVGSPGAAGTADKCTKLMWLKIA